MKARLIDRDLTVTGVNSSKQRETQFREFGSKKPLSE